MTELGRELESAEQLVAALPAAELRALAALPDDEELAVMMVDAFPEERRRRLLEQGLVERAGEEFELTEHGRRVIELARERCPDPFERIDLEALLERTQQTVDRLLAGSEKRLREIRFHEPRPTPTDRLAELLGLDRTQRRAEREAEAASRDSEPLHG